MIINCHPGRSQTWTILFLFVSYLSGSRITRARSRQKANKKVRPLMRTRTKTLLYGGFARRALTSRRLRSCYSSEYRTPELVHPVEGLDGNCNFSRTTGDF